MRGRLIAFAVLLMMVTLVASPEASAYRSGAAVPPAHGDGYPETFIWHVEAMWGENIRWSYSVNEGAVRFWLLGPDQRVIQSSDGHGTDFGEIRAPESGMYTLVWENHDVLQEALFDYEVRIEGTSHYTVLFSVLVLLAVLGLIIQKRRLLLSYMRRTTQVEHPPMQT